MNENTQLQRARELDPKDLNIEMYSSKPMGGFHVGMPKGVKITHLPTGIVVMCDHLRSQHMNRDAAMRMILAALSEQRAAPVDLERFRPMVEFWTAAAEESLDSIPAAAEMAKAEGKRLIALIDAQGKPAEADGILSDEVMEAFAPRPAEQGQRPVAWQGSDELRPRTDSERKAFLEGLEEGRRSAPQPAVPDSLLRDALAFIERHSWAWSGEELHPNTLATELREVLAAKPEAKG